MRIPNFAMLASLAFALTAGAAEEGLKLYPGATKYTPPDSEEIRKWASALPPGTTIIAYLSRSVSRDKAGIPRYRIRDVTEIVLTGKQAAPKTTK